MTGWLLVAVGLALLGTLISWIRAIGHDYARQADQVLEAEARQHPVLRVLYDEDDRP